MSSNSARKRPSNSIDTLKRTEDAIPQDIACVLEKLRERLYSRLSIEEMENLEVYLGILSAAETAHR